MDAVVGGSGGATPAHANKCGTSREDSSGNDQRPSQTTASHGSQLHSARCDVGWLSAGVCAALCCVVPLSCMSRCTALLVCSASLVWLKAAFQKPCTLGVRPRAAGLRHDSTHTEGQAGSEQSVRHGCVWCALQSALSSATICVGWVCRFCFAAAGTPPVCARCRCSSHRSAAARRSLHTAAQSRRHTCQ